MNFWEFDTVDFQVLNYLIYWGHPSVFHIPPQRRQRFVHIPVRHLFSTRLAVIRAWCWWQTTPPPPPPPPPPAILSSLLLTALPRSRTNPYPNHPASSPPPTPTPKAIATADRAASAPPQSPQLCPPSRSSPASRTSERVLARTQGSQSQL